MHRSIPSLTLLLALSACGGGSGSSAGGNNVTASSPTSAAIAVGKPGMATGVDFTVTSVSTTSQVGPAMVGGPKAEAGETFVVVSYTLKDTADKPLPFAERPALSLVDGKGQTYAPDMPATMMAGGMMTDPTGMSSDLNPNVSAKTKAAWKVDKTAFDKATWRVVVGTDPALTFALK